MQPAIAARANRIATDIFVARSIREQLLLTATTDVPLPFVADIVFVQASLEDVPHVIDGGTDRMRLTVSTKLVDNLLDHVVVHGVVCRHFIISDDSVVIQNSEATVERRHTFGVP